MTKFKTYKVIVSFCLLLIIILSCKKEDQNNDENKQGGMYLIYTSLMRSKVNAVFNISGKLNTFNSLDAAYYSYRPTTNQNVFVVYMADSTINYTNLRSIEVFTPYIKKEEFFRKGTLNSDSLRINNDGTIEKFYGGSNKARVVWDSISLYGSKFRGKGYIEIVDTIRSRSKLSMFYPPQKIGFEF